MTRRARAPIGVVVAALIALGCNDPTPLTQLIVVVDTDLLVPSQATQIEVVVVAPDATTQRAAGALSGDGAITLPATLAVVHRGVGPLGPVEITARALRGDTEVVARRARAFMVPERTMVLALHLERVCIPYACDGDTTCEHGECRPVLIDATELRPYDGELPRLDFDGGATGGCASNPELCNGIDDDCDERVDEGISLDDDPQNCGTCGNVCPTYASSIPVCVGGTCGIECPDGRGDCDLEPRNGCETPLASLTMCAECGRECRVEHGTPTCFGGVCDVFECAPGWGDCDDDASNGCEQRLDDLAHCGGCRMACAPAHAVPSCAAGICGIAACEPGWASCDGGASDGCERRIDTVTDCGACGAACTAPPNATAACVAGSCGIGRCDDGWADCNGMASDGCETRLDTLSDCGGCGVACALLHAGETCTPGGCRIAGCDPGWGDCDGIDATGCEASLETAARCGTCDRTCTAPTPLCSVGAGGAPTCSTVCGAGETLCGAQCAAIATSLENCGACGRLCAPAHATAVCSAGTCGIAACDPGWEDCNGSVADGCERRLDTLTDCGGCDVECALGGAIATCAGGRCAIATCEPGWADCDGATANGCETSLDTATSCGGCGLVCALANASESCEGGTCELVACDAGWDDCNGMVADGCETPLDSLAHCGACNTTCDLARARDSCAGGICAILACDVEWADCDGQRANGCEESLRTATSCGACGVACTPVPNASASCASGTCLQTCNRLYGDCDASPGCETRTDTLSDCGACRTPCVVGPNAAPTCGSGVCAIASCTRSDRGDCNGRIDDGCETRIDRDVLHCGGCGRRCAPNEECTGGRCRPL